MALPRRLISQIRRSLRKEDSAPGNDDYDWSHYPEIYREELRSLATEYTQTLSPDQYVFASGQLQAAGSGRPLHPNHRLLYETILDLQPATVLEAGCGAGDHLNNLKVLNPALDVFGLDLLQDQLDLLAERSPKLKEKTRVFDLTMPFSDSLPRVDLSFTQAVLMHMHSGNGHYVALTNLFRMSKRWVLLMENWTRHQFLEDVQRLYTEQMIPWPSLYSYYRRAPEYDNRPHLMVVSATPLPYEPLTDYSVMLSSTR